MRTILDLDYFTQYLSDESYQIIESPQMCKNDPDYQVGAIVKLISGVDNSKIPGYHFHDGYLTICSINAKRAQFIGIKKSSLRLLED